MLAGLKRAVARRIQARFAQGIRARLANPLGKSDLFDDHTLRVILCGTSSPLPDPDRAKACVAVIAGGKAYIVDTGPESWKTLGLLNFPGGRIAAILLTHFHSDHIGDLGEFRMQTWVGGRRRPLPVYGPAGVEQVVAGFNQAYALDDQYREAHHGADIMPRSAADLVAKPFATRAGGERFTVLEDGELTVTAFEVDHFPAAPAVGYRFDYRGRSLVISGDTKKLAAVAKAATGADVLIHDALSQPLRQVLADAAREAGNARVGKLLDDIGDYHASPIEAAETANDARVHLLVYALRSGAGAACAAACLFRWRGHVASARGLGRRIRRLANRFARVRPRRYSDEDESEALRFAIKFREMHCRRAAKFAFS